MKRLAWLVVLCCLVAACADSEPILTTDPPPTTVEVSTESTTLAPAETSETAEATTSEVTFTSGDVDLVGTLRLPASERAPGVVLIHGSGPNSRDAVAFGQLNMGFGLEIPIFAEIGEALQDAGFAVLTYDKRSCGSFNGCSDNEYPFPGDDTLVDDFIADAQAAVAFLRSLPELDPDRVSVVGHSQGGEFVTVMLAADPQLAGGAILAGPFSPIDELTEFQYTSSIDLLVSLGLTEDAARDTPGVADFSVMVDGLADIRNGSDEPVAGVTAAFWNSWFDLGQAKLDAVAGVQQPVLILGGGYDWNVPASEAAAWDDLFEASGKVHTTVILDCVTHALNCVTEPDFAALSADDIGAHVAPDVIEALIGFLSS